MQRNDLVNNTILETDVYPELEKQLNDLGLRIVAMWDRTSVKFLFEQSGIEDVTDEVIESFVDRFGYKASIIAGKAGEQFLKQMINSQYKERKRRNDGDAS